MVYVSTDFIWNGNYWFLVQENSEYKLTEVLWYETNKTKNFWRFLMTLFHHFKPVSVLVENDEIKSSKISSIFFFLSCFTLRNFQMFVFWFLKFLLYFWSFSMHINFFCQIHDSLKFLVLCWSYLCCFCHNLWTVARSSRPEVFCKKIVLRNFAKFTGKHLCQSLFFNKVADLRPATLFKKRL